MPAIVPTQADLVKGNSAAETHSGRDSRGHCASALASSEPTARRLAAPELTQTERAAALQSFEFPVLVLLAVFMPSSSFVPEISSPQGRPAKRRICDNPVRKWNG